MFLNEAERSRLKALAKRGDLASQVWSDLNDQIDSIAEAALIAFVSGRFITGSSPQTIYVNPTSGNDTTGDGLTSGTSYATIQRAVDDIPSGFKTDVVIQLAAGSFSGQNTAVNVGPGFNPATNTSSQIYIVGDQTSAYTIASTAAGSLVAGKAAQVSFTTTHGLTIVDGSHWMANATATVPTSVRVLRTSTGTEVVVVQSSTTALADKKVCAYGTTFTTTFRFGCRALSVTDSPFVHLVGIKFNSLGSTTRVAFQGCNVNTVAASIVQDCNVFSGYWGTDVTFFDGMNGRRTTFNSLFKSKLFLNGPRSSLQQCVFASSPGAGHAMLNIGTVSTTEPPVPSTTPSGVRLMSAVDFEGTGNGIHLAGLSYAIASGTITFAIVGRPVFANSQSSVSASSAQSWTGTATLPSGIRRGSHWDKTGITFSVVNTDNADQDFEIGGTNGSTIIDEAETLSEATELCTYM